MLHPAHMIQTKQLDCRFGHGPRGSISAWTPHCGRLAHDWGLSRRRMNLIIEKANRPALKSEQ
jgi:hypothetical protein